MAAPTSTQGADSVGSAVCRSRDAFAGPVTSSPAITIDWKSETTPKVETIKKLMTDAIYTNETKTHWEKSTRLIGLKVNKHNTPRPTKNRQGEIFCSQPPRTPTCRFSVHFPIVPPLNKSPYKCTKNRYRELPRLPISCDNCVKPIRKPTRDLTKYPDKQEYQ